MRFFNSRKPLFFPRLTRAQVRGVLWLLPLMAVAAVILVTANRPRFEKSFLEQVADEEMSSRNAPSSRHSERNEVESKNLTPNMRPFDYAQGDKNHPFDPNALDVGGFEELGFSRRQAEAIVRYRTARGGFREPEDLGKSYVVSPEMFARLRPWIVIPNTEGGGIRLPEGDFPRKSQRGAAAPSGGALHGVTRSLLDGSTKPDSSVLRTFGMTKGERALNDNWGASRAQGDKNRLVDLNAADSATLRTVRGVGEKLVGRIMDYRRRLGGYAKKEQLREIPGMYPENFERIAEQIFVDSAVIQKIDINFASPDVLGKHPYITSEILRKLLKHRQLKGGWRTTQELIDENILTADQARRLGPYLNFKTTEK